MKENAAGGRGEHKKTIFCKIVHKGVGPLLVKAVNPLFSLHTVKPLKSARKQIKNNTFYSFIGFSKVFEIKVFIFRLP